MSGIVRTKSQLETAFADNTVGDITAQDGRDVIASEFPFPAYTDPTPNNDRIDTAGMGGYFDTGSRWQNLTTQVIWYCYSGSPGAAVWKPAYHGSPSPGPEPVVIGQVVWSYNVAVQSPHGLPHGPDGSLLSTGTPVLLVATVSLPDVNAGPWLVAAGAWTRPAWYATGTVFNNQVVVWLEETYFSGILYKGSFYRGSGPSTFPADSPLTWTVDADATVWDTDVPATPSVNLTVTTAHGLTVNGLTSQSLTLTPAVTTMALDYDPSSAYGVIDFTTDGKIKVNGLSSTNVTVTPTGSAVALSLASSAVTGILNYTSDGSVKINGTTSGSLSLTPAGVSVALTFTNANTSVNCAISTDGKILVGGSTGEVFALVYGSYSPFVLSLSNSAVTAVVELKSSDNSVTFNGSNDTTFSLTPTSQTIDIKASGGSGGSGFSQVNLAQTVTASITTIFNHTSATGIVGMVSLKNTGGNTCKVVITYTDFYSSSVSRTTNVGATSGVMFVDLVDDAANLGIYPPLKTVSITAQAIGGSTIVPRSPGAGQTGTTSGNLSVSQTVVTGDTSVIAIQSCSDSNGVVGSWGTPSGWTSQGNWVNGYDRLQVFTKYPASSADATVTFSRSGGNFLSTLWAAQSFQGAAGLDGGVVKNGSGNASTLAVGPLTTTVNNDMLVAVCGQGNTQDEVASIPGLTTQTGQHSSAWYGSLYTETSGLVATGSHSYTCSWSPAIAVSGQSVLLALAPNTAGASTTIIGYLEYSS